MSLEENNALVRRFLEEQAKGNFDVMRCTRRLLAGRFWWCCCRPS